MALLSHPASVTSECRHTMDALIACPDVRITAAFGPQHGMRGDKQDDMIESADYVDASSLNMARCFPGTVLFEGTMLPRAGGRPPR